MSKLSCFLIQTQPLIFRFIFSISGDPSRFHSLFVVVCRLHNEPILPTELVTLGRLGTNVKKTVVLCSEDDNGQLFYTSLQWTGIS